MILNINNTPLIGAKIIDFDIDKCLNNIANALEVSVTDILGKNRQRHIVTARTIAIKTIRDNTLLTLKQIGIIFNKHHSSLIHLCTQYDVMLKYKDKYFLDCLQKTI